MRLLYLGAAGLIAAAGAQAQPAPAQLTQAQVTQAQITQAQPAQAQPAQAQPAQARPPLAQGEAAWAPLLAAGGAAAGSPGQPRDSAAPRPATVVLFRHANAPGFGDPPEFRLDDCRTQRNLDDAGREQARRIGRAFATRGVRVGAVWSSPWCRVRETADLAFAGRTFIQPAFGSFFGEREMEPRHTREAQAALNTWHGPGVLVVFTHQVNITALTGVQPASGEGVVMVREGAAWRPIARLLP